MTDEDLKHKLLGTHKYQRLVKRSLASLERVQPLRESCGYKLVGENKVQELVDKSTALKCDGAYEDLGFALIGYLQSNKVRFLAPYVSEFHALDSLRLAPDQTLVLNG